MAIIIAELGQNWVGNIELAKNLIRLAKENGADLLKMQLYDTDALYEPNTRLYKQAKEAELSFYQALMLFEYGARVGIEVFFSVFDVDRVKWCEEIGVNRYKIAARSISDRAIFSALKGVGKPVIASLPYGRCREDDLKWICRPVLWTYLYCIPEYPAKPSMLEGIKFGKRESYQGFSDHTIGLDTAKIVLARGAEIIEKHFAVDHLTGVDAPWSMTPDELVEIKRWEGVCNQIL